MSEARLEISTIMKYLVSLLALGVVVCAMSSPDDFETVLKKADEECEKEEGLDSSIAKKIEAGEITDKKVMGPMVLCVSKKIGALDKSGKIDKDVIEEKMKDVFPDKETLEKAIEKCAVDKDSSEETAINLTLCMLKEMKEHGIKKDKK